jgi:CheY-like chemotaxis protein
VRRGVEFTQYDLIPYKTKIVPAMSSTASSVTPSSNRRVLLLEDEALLAMLVEDMLLEMGFDAVDVFATLPEALAEAENSDFELAILDVNVGGHTSYPVADALKARNIPFFFATGYGRDALTDGYADAPTLQKPFLMADLERAIASLRGEDCAS